MLWIVLWFRCLDVQVSAHVSSSPTWFMAEAHRSPELERAVRRRDKQRNHALGCLDDGRKVVGGRRAGGARQEDRFIGLARDAQCVESGCPLIDDRVQGDGVASSDASWSASISGVLQARKSSVSQAQADEGLDS